jgi:hypothetical protein
MQYQRITKKRVRSKDMDKQQIFTISTMIFFFTLLSWGFFDKRVHPNKQIFYAVNFLFQAMVYVIKYL